ncbi:hypothetical protein CLU81_3589 [Flavobacterium sp. 9]|uniref:hypothetical protein n=1 Tax=Flavobacterium sp. 9 TaxID=2035198 RepID=UPI000C1A2BE7|nr:hypothetical protein [Flavobacterium sp. 9]PIF33019.1 hypothetical protein CLU81_3589 [Flavobacterium sp. 9]
MNLSTFTYSGPEAVEMIKTTFPKTWEKEIADGKIFIKGLMKYYNLSAKEAFERYLKSNGCPANSIATLASLHLMLEQSKTSHEIQKLEEEQLAYGNQLVALEQSTISYEDKKTLRSHYITKQNELQKRINELILQLPVIGSETISVRTDLFG